MSEPLGTSNAAGGPTSAATPPTTPGHDTAPNHTTAGSGSSGGAASRNGVAGAAAPPAAAPNLATTARYSFEDGTDTWGPFWQPNNLHFNITTQLAYDGTHSLLLNATPTSNPPAIGTDHISGLTPGMTVTMHLHYDGQGQGQIVPFVQDPKFNPHWPGGAITMPAGSGWITLTFTVPTFPSKESASNSTPPATRTCWSPSTPSPGDLRY